MINFFLVWFLKKFKLVKILSEINNDLKLKQNLKFISNNGCVLHNEAKIYNLQEDPNKIRIGNKTQICGTLKIFKYGGEIIIGQDSYVGDNSRIWSGEKIKIGNNVLISHNVNIIDSTSHEIDYEERSIRYKDLIENGPWESKGSIITAPITIEDNVWINFNVIILKGVHIGEGAIIAAGSTITKDVPAFTLYAGNPAKEIKKL